MNSRLTYTLGAILFAGAAVTILLTYPSIDTVPVTILDKKPSTDTDPDTRIRLMLSAEERHLVLTEMRSFVSAINAITGGLANDDITAVESAARSMGSQAANAIPPNVVAKLPDTFKQYAYKVHSTFDQIAMDAEAFGDTKHTIGQLNNLTQNCVGCHAIYQIEKK